MKTKINLRSLPYYLTAYKIIENDSVKVEVESKVHVNRVVQMPTSFSIGFVAERPNQFLGYVLNFIVNRYGLQLEEPRYV